MTDILYSDIDKAEMPPGLGTFDRPWYWYTYRVPEGEQCTNPECDGRAHAGLVFMREGDKDFWQKGQATEEKMEADVVFYCANHFMPAVNRLTESP